MRLCFRVTYVANGVEHHETILSHPFRVFSNKRMGDVVSSDRRECWLLHFVNFLLQQGPPTVLNLLPKCGHHGTDTEVWIKGRNFTDRFVFGRLLTSGDARRRVRAKCAHTDDNMFLD